MIHKGDMFVNKSVIEAYVTDPPVGASYHEAVVAIPCDTIMMIIGKTEHGFVALARSTKVFVYAHWVPEWIERIC